MVSNVWFSVTEHSHVDTKDK